MKAIESAKNNEMSMEMLVEKERASLGKTVTKVTLETFLAWKKRKLVEKKEEKILQETKKQANFKMGLHQGLSGRDLFTFNPELVGDDDDGGDESNFDYRQRDDDDQGFECRDVNLDDFEAREADDTGTTAGEDRFSYMDSVYKQEKDNEMAAGGGDVIVEDVEGEQSAVKEIQKDDDELTEQQHEESLKKMIGKNSKKTASDKKKLKEPKTNIEIDESLFDGADLGDIDDELENLELDDE